MKSTKFMLIKIIFITIIVDLKLLLFHKQSFRKISSHNNFNEYKSSSVKSLFFSIVQFSCDHHHYFKSLIQTLIDNQFNIINRIDYHIFD
jgi:hypothetical protein